MTPSDRALLSKLNALDENECMPIRLTPTKTTGSIKQ